ncbi:hypothetical protein CHARACLAT_013523 [Characodon lateralis]|uniref:Uncharacterized protein n=1 Tax=Characodon lateralis TaxID=208331 RepID=A0ABU7E2E2_9TELE|nr:hypothetical protein [Characodon lateralis]
MLTLQQSLILSMHVATMERKNSLLTGRNLQQNQAQCEAIFHDSCNYILIQCATTLHISSCLVYFAVPNAYYILKIWTVQFCCFSIELRFVYLPKTDGQTFCSGDAPPVVGVPGG